VNAIGQRTNVAQSGTAFAAARSTAWGYDSLGQVTRADSTIPGLDRAYQFDLIGNRLKTADSLTLPVANNYTPNALNQYSSITNPQSAILNPLHDADGNMTSGPLPANITANSTLVWDGENRLIQATVGTTGAVVRYSYDSQSRRIAETVGTTTKLTIYDGWNPIAEYAIQNSTFTIQNSYLWGIDLSGTLQGAGGVGGLLMTSLITNNSITSNYFPTYDGNGNVSEYLDSTGAVVAHYEYDPFGKTTVATGPKANDFAHRFSTKPLDATTGLYYYGYRYYDPQTGRWPSRDPIWEEGGINLYGFIGNNGVNDWDRLGLVSKPEGYTSKASELNEKMKELEATLTPPVHPPCDPPYRKFTLPVNDSGLMNYDDVYIATYIHKASLLQSFNPYSTPWDTAKSMADVTKVYDVHEIVKVRVVTYETICVCEKKVSNEGGGFLEVLARELQGYDYILRDVKWRVAEIPRISYTSTYVEKNFRFVTFRPRA
jgi:RHS repeat-associated protein